MRSPINRTARRIMQRSYAPPTFTVWAFKTDSSYLRGSDWLDEQKHF
jgi:hypothetical protein